MIFFVGLNANTILMRTVSRRLAEQEQSISRGSMRVVKFRTSVSFALDCAPPLSVLTNTKGFEDEERL